MGLQKFIGILKKKGDKPTSSIEFQKFISNQLKIKVVDWSLYEQAFVHRTKAKTPSQSNERLEFVGDAILDAVVAAWLFQKFKSKDEGFLSKMKSRIVSRASLNELATELGINAHIKSTLNSKSAFISMGGNALEALIGALYQDNGYEVCALWIHKQLLKKIDLNKSILELNDSKSELYERAHRDRADLNLTTQELSLQPEPKFETIVLWNNQEAGKATGSSKKIAEQNAAQKALLFINGT